MVVPGRAAAPLRVVRVPSALFRPEESRSRTPSTLSLAVKMTALSVRRYPPSG